MPSALAPRVRERAALAFLLVPPLAWLIIAYLGSLAVLMVSAFWSTNSFTGAVVHKFTTDNLVRVLTDDVFRAVTKAPEMRERSAIRSSVIPSTKWSSAALPVKFASGRTATERLGGDKSDCCREEREIEPDGSVARAATYSTDDLIRWTSTGLAMFLTSRSPSHSCSSASLS